MRNGRSLAACGHGRAGSELGRHLAEEQLKESEERYALALRGSSDGIWDWNITTGQAVLSPRWKALLGFAEDEVATGFRMSLVFSAMHPEDVPRVKAEIERHFARTPYDVQMPGCYTKDGTYRWVQTRPRRYGMTQGAPIVWSERPPITERSRPKEGATLANGV